MCGIHFTLNKGHGFRYPSKKALENLRDRGPDALCTIEESSGHGGINSSSSDNLKVFMVFTSSVLSLRGSEITVQPLIDEDSDSVLCWNGEAWSINDLEVEGNDAKAVHTKLQNAARDDSSFAAIVKCIGNIKGPYAFVYYDKLHENVWFGRDCLGRRSLLYNFDRDGTFRLSSVGEGSLEEGWAEVEADGIYCLNLKGYEFEPVTNGEDEDLSNKSILGGSVITHVPYQLDIGEDSNQGVAMVNISKPRNKGRSSYFI
jgi:asparagine synthetase B (glutamine-hydrolysing)